MKRLITILTLLAAGTSLALAEENAPAGKPPGGPEGEHKKRDPEAFFKKMDTNADGSISLDEFKAGPRGKKDPAKAEEHFKKIDTNADGKLSLDELKAGRPPGGGKHKEKGEKAPQ